MVNSATPGAPFNWAKLRSSWEQPDQAYEAAAAALARRWLEPVPAQTIAAFVMRID